MRYKTGLLLGFGGVLLAASASAQPLRDCPDCPEMVALPAGSFTMGRAGWRGAEPAHQVSLRAFAIGRHEVTGGQWQAVMGTAPPAEACTPDCPVSGISWEAANEFARRLSARTGQTYRLPSEAEWEYACQAGAATDYCGGDDPENLAWYGDERAGARPVGGKAANAWGVHDMSGNVWEWTADCMVADYRGAPTDGSPRVTGDCRSRVLRGGSWRSGAQYARAVIRFGFSPAYRGADFGFRVVRELP
ncbi:formylglycine-generating enzyme family protein [Azonexus sp.]|uniref:formylglycine-generating enzyme family protein n=1 Tax=Azonexus sp. TaxID=1872668 RepID=UPI0027B9D254|nr:formylglycine-generating enzyme family protein [Azonexus sp.]